MTYWMYLTYWIYWSDILDKLDILEWYIGVIYRIYWSDILEKSRQGFHNRRRLLFHVNEYNSAVLTAPSYITSVKFQLLVSSIENWKLKIENSSKLLQQNKEISVNFDLCPAFNEFTIFLCSCKRVQNDKNVKMYLYLQSIFAINICH